MDIDEFEFVSVCQVCSRRGFSVSRKSRDFINYRDSIFDFDVSVEIGSVLGVYLSHSVRMLALERDQFLLIKDNLERALKFMGVESEVV